MFRILVADDEEPIRRLVTRVLERNGYAVEGAGDGQQAIDRLKSGNYDAVVLDLMMPKVDGIGVIQYMTEECPVMVQKTVVVTAFPRTAARNELGAVCHVLPKPFDLPVCLESVKECTKVPNE